MAKEREGMREKREAWLGGLQWPMMMAYDGAYDSGSGHGGLVMAFMSTMVLGLKRREQTREKKTRKRGK